MRLLGSNSIRSRLLQRLLLGYGALIACGMLLVYFTAGRALRRQFDQGLWTKAMALMSAVEEDNGQVVLDSSDPVSDGLERQDTYYEIQRADGTQVACSHALQGQTLSTIKNTPGVPADAVLANGTQTRALALRFHPHPSDDAKGKNPGVEATLVVACDRHDLDRTLATLASILASVGLLTLALTATAVPPLLRRELTPVEALAAKAQRINPELLLTERFPTDNLPSELQPVTARLNDLLDRLQGALERERQFSDALAHEFRTPIAELRNLAEVNLKWADSRTPQTDNHVLAIALQMESMINRLLAIARGERGQMLPQPERVDLCTLFQTLWEPLKERAIARGVRLDNAVAPETILWSDPVLLRAIFCNLLENAVEYADEEGTVSIRAELLNNHFTIKVQNPVKGFEAEDVTHLFERFWRKDPARSGSPHCGLGLPLARAFATSLGLTLRARWHEDSQLSFELRGPIQPPTSTPNNSVPQHLAVENKTYTSSMV